MLRIVYLQQELYPQHLCEQFWFSLDCSIGVYNMSVCPDYFTMKWAYVNSLEKCLKILLVQERVMIKYSLLQWSTVRWIKAINLSLMFSVSARKIVI
jgi:hypothetical protein